MVFVRSFSCGGIISSSETRFQLFPVSTVFEATRKDNYTFIRCYFPILLTYLGLTALALTSQSREILNHNTYTIYCVRVILSLEAESSILLVRDSVLPNKLPIQEIRSIELNTGLSCVHFQEATSIWLGNPINIKQNCYHRRTVLGTA